MGIVRALWGFFVILLVFSSSCLAMEKDDPAKIMADLAEYKSAAIGYAYGVSDHYNRVYNLYTLAKDSYVKTANPTNAFFYNEMAKNLQAHTKAYLGVREKYSLAAAKFEPLRSALKLSILTHNRLPSDEEYYDLKIIDLMNNAKRKYADYEVTAQNYLKLGVKIERVPVCETDNTGETTITKTAAIASVEDYILSFIFPVVDKYLEIRKQIAEEKAAKRDKLLAWVDEFYKWDDWKSIGASATSETPAKVK